jgi:probable rRNA maturation factor
MNDRLSLQIADKFSSYIDHSKIRQAVDQTLEYSESPDQMSLTIVFQEDEFLHRMNIQFLEIDAPTDVLSFPAEYKDPETQESYLGDVLISVPRAIAQASEGNHSVEEELQMLVVHGVLHLLGYDHIEETDKEHMQEAQSSILRLLGNNLDVKL